MRLSASADQVAELDRRSAALADYNALGIEVRYLAYPRAGLESQTADKIVSAWCADNRNEALTALIKTYLESWQVKVLVAHHYTPSLAQ